MSYFPDKPWTRHGRKTHKCLYKFGVLVLAPLLLLCILLPCRGQGLSANRASHWQVLSTDAKMSGDMMFIHGCFGEECTVPVGYSFKERGMREDCHDVVSAQLMLPVSQMPAARGASQPAVAAASAQQALAPAHAADAGRPAAGEAMLSKQMESPWQFFKRIENLLIAPGHFGPRGGWKRILFEKSLPKMGS